MFSKNDQNKLSIFYLDQNGGKAEDLDAPHGALSVRQEEEEEGGG